jgi:phosphate transport system protein
MERYFDADLNEHRDRILRMSYMALENLERAVNGLFTRDEQLLREAVERDREIDQMELRIDAECVELLLRLQPVAKDLRLAVMSLKINTNLERMGDQAVFIARVGLDLQAMLPVQDWFRIQELSARTHEAVSLAVTSFSKEDTALARQVREGDKEINRLYRTLVLSMVQFAMDNPTQLPQMMELMSVAQALERVADYGKNIADEVVYLVEAEDPRHRT